MAVAAHLCLPGGLELLTAADSSGSLLLVGGGPRHIMRRHDTVRFGPSTVQLFLAGVAHINYF